jgi:hypothetical protein
MTNGPRPEFRLRYLLDPFYLIRRCRELGSAARILRAAAGVARNVRGRCENTYYELRGLPGSLKTRGLAAYYTVRGWLRRGAARLQDMHHEMRGLPAFLWDRAESLYHRVDMPSYLRTLTLRISRLRLESTERLRRFRSETTGRLGARGEAAYYEARGTLLGVSARLRNACHELRGLPGFIKDRAESLYHKLDVPRHERRLTGMLNYCQSKSMEALRRCRSSLAETANRCRSSLVEAVSHYRSKSIAVLRHRPIPPAPWGPLTMLRPEVRRDKECWAEQFQTAKPYKHVVIDGFLDPELCRDLTAEFPLGPSYRKLDKLSGSPDFLRFVSAITGIPDLLHDPAYLGGGAREDIPGTEIAPHVDSTVHKKTGLYRRVNLILSLNPEWDEAWEGELELHFNPWLPADKNTIKTISPAFNRCVLFETSDRSWHGHRPTRLPERKKGLIRSSFALHLYTRKKPDFPTVPDDLAVFVDRPLPPELKPGRRLTEEDVRGLQLLLARRDWKLSHLYDRSISLYNDWQLSQAQLKESLRSLLRRRSIADFFRDLLR